MAPVRASLGLVQGLLDLACCSALGSRRSVIVGLLGAESENERGRRLVFERPRLTVEEEADHDRQASSLTCYLGTKTAEGGRGGRKEEGEVASPDREEDASEAEAAEEDLARQVVTPSRPVSSMIASRSR
jgi:hypothetical protein